MDSENCSHLTLIPAASFSLLWVCWNGAHPIGRLSFGDSLSNILSVFLKLEPNYGFFHLIPPFVRTLNYGVQSSLFSYFFYPVNFEKITLSE